MSFIIIYCTFAALPRVIRERKGVLGDFTSGQNIVISPLYRVSYEFG